MNEKAILVEPEIPENTGFIARLAANFGYELRIVNPEFNLSEARGTASKAQDKLRDAEIYGSAEEAVKDLDYVIGTKPGRGRKMESMEPLEGISVMIGRESSGLSGDELELCDAVVHISTGDYSSINQSHAAAILFHHFHTQEDNEKVMEEGQKQILSGELPESVMQKLLESAPTREEADAMIGDLKNVGGRDS